MKRLNSLRRRTFEERKIIRQLILSLVGIISVIFFILLVGIPFVIKVSTLIAGFKKENISNQTDLTVIPEPSLDFLPTATNSAKISITGTAGEGDIVILYLNSKIQDERVADKNGLFIFNNVLLKEGENEIYAISKRNNKQSPPSTKAIILYDKRPPILEIENPQDKSIYKQEEREIEIRGQTEEGVNLYINDRLTIVNPDGGFSAKYILSEGENKIKIKAVDLAGNLSEKEVTVIYES